MLLFFKVDLWDLIRWVTSAAGTHLPFFFMETANSRSEFQWLQGGNSAISESPTGQKRYGGSLQGF